MFHIHWSSTSEETYADILEPLSQDAALKLDNKVEALIDNLRLYRFLCPPSKLHPTIRNCMVSNKIGMAYQVDKTIINLLYFYYNNSVHQP